MPFPGQMRHRARRHPGRIAMFVLLLPCLVAVAGWVVKALWNAVLVEALGARPLSFWQALGLLLLCRILLGHWGPRGRGPWSGPGRTGGPGALRDKWRSMTPEQRDRFRSHWKARCAGPASRAADDDARTTNETTPPNRG